MKKIISTALIGVMTFGMVFASGCNGQAGANSATDIEITFWRSGMGDEFMNEIVTAFEAKNPEYKVHLKSETTNTAIADNIMNGAKYNTVDLYFEPVPSNSLYQYLEPLDDVLPMINAGESKKISEKISPSLLENYRFYDGKYYTLPYGGGVCGFVYNEDLMEGFEIPNTTNELRNLVFDLYTEYDGQNCKPFIHFAGGYWDYAYNIWQAQYDGLDYYYNTFSTLGQDVSVLGTSNENPSLEVLVAKDGRYQALKVMETLLDPQYVAAGSNAADHTTQQTKFLNGRAVMMCNGSWLSNEMKTSDSEYKNFSVMKTPIISSITDKLTDVKTDALLSAVVEVVDKVVDGEIALSDVKQSDGRYKIGDKTICESDWNRIYEVRNIVWENYSQHAICIPNYASAKEGAKKFVAFYFSDEAQKIMNNKTHMSLPFTFDKAENKPNVSTWSGFEKSMYDFSQKYTMVGMVESRRSLVFTRGGAAEYGMVNFVGAMNQGSGAKTADEMWTEITGKLTENWTTYLSNAGLK